MERGESIEIARELWQRYRGKSGLDLSYGTYHEFIGKKTTLSLYGPCLQVLLRDRAKTVRIISLRYVNFNEITPFFSRLREYSNLQVLKFSDNDFFSFYQIDTLSILALTELYVENNSICNQEHFRAYSIFRVPSLHIVNAISVSEDERSKAVSLFGEHLFSALCQTASTHPYTHTHTHTHTSGVMLTSLPLYASIAPLKLLWKKPSIRRIKGFCPPSLDYVEPVESDFRGHGDEALQDYLCSKSSRHAFMFAEQTYPGITSSSSVDPGKSPM